MKTLGLVTSLVLLSACGTDMPTDGLSAPATTIAKTTDEKSEQKQEFDIRADTKPQTEQAIVKQVEKVEVPIKPEQTQTVIIQTIIKEVQVPPPAPPKYREWVNHQEFWFGPWAGDEGITYRVSTFHGKTECIAYERGTLTQVSSTPNYDNECVVSLTLTKSQTIWYVTSREVSAHPNPPTFTYTSKPGDVFTVRFNNSGEPFDFILGDKVCKRMLVGHIICETGE